MNRHNRLGWRRKGFIFAFLAPTLIAFVIFYLYPIVTVFVTSFCKWDYTNINAPEFFGIKNMWDNSCWSVFMNMAADVNVDEGYVHSPEKENYTQATV